MKICHVTCWLALAGENDEDTTFCIVSMLMLSCFIVPMQGTIMTGCITHQSVFEQWTNLGQDHDEYLTHIKMAQSNKSDIDKVFRLMDGSETTYVSPDFRVQTYTPEHIPQVYAAVMRTIGCDRHTVPQPHPRLLSTHMVCNQWLPPLLRLLPKPLSVRVT